MSPAVFLTGGSGLLALNWALAMRQCFEITLGLHHKEISLQGVRSRRVSLESADSLIREFETMQPDIVIHAAGLTNVDECEAKPGLAQHVNVDLSSNVAKACAKLGLKLIYISTDHLFSGDVPLVNETHPTQSKNVYGRTKAEAEIRVLEEDSHALIVRTNFYGWGTVYRRSFSDFIIETLLSGKQLKLFKDVYYTPILIETLVQAVHDLVDLRAEGIFNVVGDDRISKYDFGLRIAERFNLDADLIIPGLLSDMSILVQRPFDMSLSNQKVSKMLHRKLGGTEEHINRLHAQDQSGLAKELKLL